jgi:hypothetical protein
MKSQHRTLLWTTGLIALIVACIFSIWSYQASEPAVSPVHATLTVPRPDGGGTFDQSGSSRLEASTVEHAMEPGLPEVAFESATEAIEFGTVVGAVFDYDGEPIPRARIAFEGSEPGGCTHTAEEEGQFRVSLPAGIWTIYYIGSPQTEERGWIAMGAVEVPANQEAYLDLYLPGNRRLMGGFRRSDMDMVLLEVELYDLRDPNRVVAKTLCGTNNAEHAAWLESLEYELEDQDVPPPALSQGVGRFELEALPPAYYEIRVYMDIGKRFYVRAEVDLTDADFEFEPVSLEEADFLGRKTLDL